MAFANDLKIGDKYYSIAYIDSIKKVIVVESYYGNTTTDKIREQLGIIYKTRDDAEDDKYIGYKRAMRCINGSIT